MKIEGGEKYSNMRIRENKFGYPHNLESIMQSSYKKNNAEHNARGNVLRYEELV